MATKKIADNLLSRRQALGILGAVGVTALTGCGSDSSSGAPPTPPSPAPSGTATASPRATATGALGTPTGTAQATGTPRRTPTPTATPRSATATPSSTPPAADTATPAALSCVVTPAETEGPYFVDEKLNRSDLTSDTTDPAVLNGLPLRLQLGVYTVDGNACTPLAGAQVDVWHADAVGIYSDEQAQESVGETFLRGYQVTDQNGAVTFETIYPGWYPGRTVHIHFKVRTFSASGATAFEFTSQLFFDDALTDTVFANAPYNSRGPRDTRNANDSIYNSELLVALAPASNGSGYAAAFTIGLRLS